MLILDGKKLAAKKTKTLVKEFKEITKLLGREPIIAILQVGNNESSNKYIEYKMKKAEELGIKAIKYHYEESATQRSILKNLDKINETADGIIVQLPLPENLASQVILDSVRHQKDIDGLSNRNTFAFYNEIKEFYFAPATALAIVDLLKANKIKIKDKKIAVVGRSNLVGKPTAFLLKKEGGNVSTYNRETTIKGIENADIVVVSTGVAHLVKKENLKQKAVVVDVGANWVIDKNGKKVLQGDVDPFDLDNHIKAFAPVPGGVGPVTVVTLFENLAKAIRHNNQI